MSEPFIGEIKLVPYDFAPRGWLFCYGQVLQISQYSTLFALLGDRYGGDGRSTFALPDLRGRVPMSSGQGPGLLYRELGERGGMEYVPLVKEQIPAHTHDATAVAKAVVDQGSGGSGGGTTTGNLKVHNGTGNTNDPTQAKSIAAKAGSFKILSTNDATDTISGAVTGIQSGGSSDISVKVSVDVATDNTGGGQPHTNLQPFTVLNYIIAIEGLFPSRN